MATTGSGISRSVAFSRMRPLADASWIRPKIRRTWLAASCRLLAACRRETPSATAAFDPFYGPGLNNWDLAAHKEFSIDGAYQVCGARRILQCLESHSVCQPQYRREWRFELRSNHVNPTCVPYCAGRRKDHLLIRICISDGEAPDVHGALPFVGSIRLLSTSFQLARSDVGWLG